MVTFGHGRFSLTQLFQVAKNLQRLQKKKMAERTLKTIPSAIVDSFAARQSLSVSSVLSGEAA
jgi:hypothetical protein